MEAMRQKDACWVKETHTDKNNKAYPDVQYCEWSEPQRIYHMMSTLGITQVQLLMQSVTFTISQGQDQDSPTSADEECGSLPISRRQRKDLSSLASIIPLARH